MCSELNGAMSDPICVVQAPSRSSYTRATDPCEPSAAKAMRLPLVETAALLESDELEMCRWWSTGAHFRTRRVHSEDAMLRVGNFAP